MNLYDIETGFPEAVQLLWCLLFFFWCFALLQAWRRRQEARLYGSLQLATALIAVRPYGMQIARLIALSLVWIAATAALMDPRGNPRYSAEASALQDVEEVIRQPPQQVALILDASASMLVPDTKSGVSRFIYAKELAEDIVNALPGGVVLSLHVFTSKVHLISPPTNDYFFVRMMLDQIQINEGETSGTDFKSLVTWLEEYEKKQSKSRLLSFIILSDGGDNFVEPLSQAQKSKYVDTLVKGISESFRQKAQLLTIGVGSKEGGIIPGILNKGNTVKSALHELILRQLAQRGGGEYWMAQAVAPLTLAQEVVYAIKGQMTVAVNLMKQRHHLIAAASEVTFDEYFQQPLLLAMFAMIVSWAIPFYWPPRHGRALLCVAAFAAISLIFSSCNKEPGIIVSRGKKEEVFIAEQLRYGAAAASLGDLAGAYSRYTALLQRELPLEQRALLLYNCSVIEMKQRHWEEALSYIFQAFDALAAKGSSAPLLQQRLYANFASIRLMQARAAINQKDKGEMAYGEAALLYQGAEYGLQNAIALGCALDKEFGETSCRIRKGYMELQQLLTAMKEELSSRYYNKNNAAVERETLASAELFKLVDAIVRAQASATARHALQHVLAVDDMAAISQNKILQQIAFDLERQFVPAAIRWQRQQYNAAAASGSDICLKSPWDKVFPQAERGWQAGAAALERLEAGVSGEEVLWRQWEAWQAWTSVQQAIKESAEKKDISSTVQTLAASSSFDKALRNLEAMKKEDDQNKGEGQVLEDARW